MIAKFKITENFCVIDECYKNFDKEIFNHVLISPSAERRRKMTLLKQVNSLFFRLLIPNSSLTYTLSRIHQFLSFLLFIYYIAFIGT